MEGANIEREVGTASIGGCTDARHAPSSVWLRVCQTSGAI